MDPIWKQHRNSQERGKSATFFRSNRTRRGITCVLIRRPIIDTVDHVSQVSQVFSFDIVSSTSYLHHSQQINQHQLHNK